MPTNKYLKIIDQYIRRDDISRHNSNLIYSVPAMNAIVHGAVSKDYWFERVYKERARTLNDEGWLYIHNMDVLGPYCSGYSAVDLAIKGLNSNAKNTLRTKPPKHVHSLLGQCSNFITLVSQEIHGACAINDLTTVVASYWFVENEIFGLNVEFEDIKNAWQHFIYEVNMAFRSGNSAFSNITMKPDGPDVALKDDFVAFAGKHLTQNEEFKVHGKTVKIEKDIFYKDVPLKYYQETNRAFIDVFAEGDAEGKPFTFPLITVNIDDNFNFNDEVFELLLTECDKWGGIYLENYRTKPFDEESDFKKLNPYIQARNPELQKSFCCRFQVGLEDILKINSSIFRSGSGVGGLGVFNINLNRIGYVAHGDWDLYYKLLGELMDTVQELAQRKREFIQQNMDLYPYWSYYNKSLDSYYNVISICGGHESLVNMGIEDGLNSEAGIDKGTEIAKFMRDRISMYIKRDKVPVSLEYAPSESAAPKLAKSDLQFVEWLASEEPRTTPLSAWTYKMFAEDIYKQYVKGVYFVNE